MENGSPDDFPECVYLLNLLCKPKFVSCSFVDELTKGSFPFANGLNATRTDKTSSVFYKYILAFIITYNCR
jgi:hypothetical protein